MTMFHFRLFREKTKEPFFFKNPTNFGPLCPFLGKQNVPLNSVPISIFLKLRPSIIVPNFEEVMSDFQATLVSEARMHTCLEQA